MKSESLLLNVNTTTSWTEELIDVAPLCRAEVSGTVRDWKTANVYYRSCNYHKVQEGGSIRVYYDQSFIQLLFLVRGNTLSTGFDLSGMPFSLLPGQFTLFLHPENKFRTLFFSQCARLEVCVVNLPVDYLQTIPYAGSGTDHLQHQLVFGNFIGPLSISAEILRSLHQINHVKLHNRSFRAGLLDTKIQELVLMALEVYHNEQKTNSEPTTDTADKITAIGQLLADNLDKNYTLEQLAHCFTCSTTFIKQQFKKSYGKTVSGYMTMLRMEKALALLRSYQTPIADIADQVGYKHATHFTVAFKRYYGVLPKSFRL